MVAVVDRPLKSYSAAELHIKCVKAKALWEEVSNGVFSLSHAGHVCAIYLSLRNCAEGLSEDLKAPCEK